MFKTTKERKQREYEVRSQYAGMQNNASPGAMEFGRRPPYMYTSLCPDKRNQWKENQYGQDQSIKEV